MRSSPADLPPRDPRSGALRPAGIIVAMATAAAVFGVGVLLFTRRTKPEPASAPVTVEPPTPTPAAAPSPVTAPLDAGPTDADVDQADVTESPEPPPFPPSIPSPGPEPKPGAPTAAAKSAPPPSRARPEAASTDTTKTATRTNHSTPREKPNDKDVARDAWRKNLPDISPEPGKAAILIPIKGSIESATYHVTVKPRSVLIVSSAQGRVDDHHAVLQHPPRRFPSALDKEGRRDGRHDDAHRLVERIRRPPGRDQGRLRACHRAPILRRHRARRWPGALTVSDGDIHASRPRSLPPPIPHPRARRPPNRLLARRRSSRRPHPPHPRTTELAGGRSRSYALCSTELRNL